MSPLWTSADAEAATGGRSTAAWTAAGVSIDSRTIARGDLFVALAGPTHDGHDHVGAAIERGAAAAMVHRTGLPGDAGPLLRVADTFEGLRDLARAARARSSARIAAVTGSVGKTGVKDALRLVLGRQGGTHASIGNLNNHWGAPLSLARMAPDAAWGVFELGMNHAGEISPLSRMVRPHVAVITTIAAAHAAHFDSVEAIADAKAEIFDGVEAGGAAILNRDNAHFDRLAAAARRRHIDRIVTFGEHAHADARLLAADLAPDGSRVEAEIDGRTLAYRVGAPGRHWALNSVAVLATVSALGADVPAAAAALAEMTAPSGRGRQLRVSLGDGGFSVIDESYNASPAAVRAALEVLSLGRPGPRGRRIAILGDMLELGTEAAALHAGLSEPVRESGVDLLFAAGPEMKRLYDGVPAAIRGGYAADAASLLPAIAGTIRDGDVVLVKGSLGMNMAQVVRGLLSIGGEG